MKKKLRRLSQIARMPLMAFFTFCLVTQLFPLQGMAYAAEQVTEALGTEEQVAAEAPAPEPEPEPAPAPAPEPEPEPEPAPAPEPEPEPAAPAAVDEPEPAPAAVDEPEPAADTTPDEAIADEAVDTGETDQVEPEVEGDEPEAEKEEPMRAGEGEEVETWTVSFYNDSAVLSKKVEVEKGSAIGELPETIAREGYNAYWAVGEIIEGGQGHEIHKTGDRIDETWVPEADTVIVPDYELIEYTITFVNESGGTVATKKVNYDTNYCLDEIPDVPEKAGYTGRWVYNGSEFDNTVSVNSNITVSPEYDQDVFNVTYMVDGEIYETDEYYKGDTLTLPAEPVVAGKEFVGWYAGETEIVGGEPVNSDMTIEAKLNDEFSVEFVVLNDDGSVHQQLHQYFRTSGETIGTMPQDPFVAGKVFERWVDQATGEVVTADTAVISDMTVVAQFRTVTIYNITAEYYYVNDRGGEVIFNTDLMQVEAHEFPYTITAPSTTQTDPDEVAGAPIYYPSTPTVTVTESDFNEEHEATVRVLYVPYTAEYDFVYLLKNLDGNGYTEIERTQDVQGVLNSYVTPTVKTYEYATLELAEGATITQAQGQELNVYYNRKNFQLSYETNGGTYVPGETVPYGTTVDLPSDDPTREGYTFDGWYSDEGLTQRVTGAVTVNADTTLYAKWNGQTVNYTIVYMVEEYDNATGTTSYVYDNSRTATATVGSTVQASSAPNLSNRNGYERHTSMDYEGSSVTIAADGSSVVVVHYDLIRYTIVFNLNNNNGRITMGGQTYTGNNYRITNVVLGQDVSSMWPSSSNEVYSTATTGNRYFGGWTGASEGTYITKRYELIWSNVSGANNQHVMTFTASWSGSSYDRDAQYWLQQPDGTWVVADEYTQRGLNTNNLGAKNIDGYTQHNGNASRPNNSYPNSGNTNVQVWVDEYDDVVENYGSNNRYNVGDTVRYNNNNYTVTARRNGGFFDRYDYYYTLTRHVDGHYETQQRYVYNFYYDRSQYTITYMDGSTTLRTTEPIFFEADISGAAYNYTPDKPEGKEDYTWGGWYADSALQTPYTFTTMPGHNEVVYAKWVAPTFEVTFEMDGGTPVAPDQTVEKYHKAEKPANPTKEGYTFDGWYTSADGDVLFDWQTQIVEDTTVYAHWSRNTLSYTVRYVDEDDNEVATAKTVSNPNFTVGQSITEQAIAVAGYRPQTSSQTLELTGTDADNVITFVYSSKAETTSYKVRYVIADGEAGAGTAVAAEKTVPDVPGNTSSVIELAAAIDYDAFYAAHPDFEGVEFHPDEVEKTLVLTANENENVLTFYYSSYKHVDVTVNFVDMNGDPIASADTQVLKVGNTYTLSRTPISGWELYAAVEGTSLDGAAASGDYKITDAVADSGGLTFTLFYQKKATVTANSASKTYDGDPLTLPDAVSGQVHVEGLLAGHSLTGVTLNYSGNDVDNGRLNAGTATVTPSNAVISEAADNYYRVRYIAGTLTVSKINVTIRVEPDRWTGNTYNGEEYETGFTNNSKGIADYVMISHEGYEEEYLDDVWAAIIALDNVIYDESAAGLKYYVEAEKDAGDYQFTVGLTKDMLPNDPNYSVNLYVRQGLLQILPKDATITTGSAEKAYDGTPLTKDEAAIEGLVDADADKVTVDATGTQTEVGESTNSYEIVWGGVNPNNYNITENLGTLKVTEAELKITVKGKTVPYNGVEQSGYAVTTVIGTGETIETAEYIIEGLAEGQELTIDGYTPATGTNVGTYTNGSFDDATITVKSGDDNVTSFYNVTTVAGNLTINPKAVTITADDASKTYDGAALTESGFTASELEEGDTHTFTVTMTDDSTITDVGTQPNVIATVDGVAVAAGTATAVGNYLVTTANGTLTVNPKAVNITAGDANKPYDGTPLTQPEFTASDLEEGDTHTFTVVMTDDSTITNVGTQPNVIATVDGVAVTAGTATAVGNYLVTTANGTLTVTQDEAEIVITSATTSWTYDGASHKEEIYTVTYNDGTLEADSTGKVFTLPNGDVITITATAAGVTNVSDNTSNNNTYTYTITRGETDTSGNYKNVVANVGTLTINPKAVTITAEDASKPYDGNPLTEPGFTASALEAGDTHTFTVVMTDDSTITNVGTQPNVIATVDGVAVTAGTAKQVGNYLVTTVDGELEITPLEVTVTITGNKGSLPYNGQEQKVEGYEVEISNKLYTTADFTFSGEDVAAGTNVGTYPMGLAKEQFTNTNDNFTVTFEVTDGELKITPIDVTVTITEHSDEVDYDGNVHTVTGYDVTSIKIDGEDTTLYTAADFTFNGTASVSGTDAGTYPMELKPEDFTNTNTNFGTVTFVIVDGSLVIDPIDVVVTIVGNNNTTAYDGTEHTVTGYTATASSDLYDVTKDFTFSGTAEAKRTDAGTTNMGLAADQFANTNQNFTNVTFNVTDGFQTITPIDVVVTITGASNTTPYDGEAHTVTGYTATANSTLFDVAKDFTFSGTATATRTNVVEGTDTDGKTEMGLTPAMFTNNNPNFASVTFNVTDGYQEITPIDVTVTIEGANNTTKFDGNEHSVSGYDVQISNPLYMEADFSFSGTAEAKRTDVGTTNMNLEASQFVNNNTNFGNVTFNVTDGYQTITPADKVVVTITGHSNTADYDGEEHSVSGYDVQISNPLYKETDFTFTGTAEAARTNVVEGDDADGKTDMGLTPEMFTNNNTNFAEVEFVVIDGYQAITPISVTVTIEGANNTTDYDGAEHTVTGYTATASSDLYDVTKDFTFSGTDEAKRTDAGTTNMGLAADQFANTNQNFTNVTFNVTDGFQTITPINVVVTIVGANNTATYDGAEHTVTGYTATASSDLYDVTKDFTFSGTDEAKRTDAGTTNMGLAADQFANTNTNFGTVTFEVTDGYQTIEKRVVTVSVADKTVEYNGSEQFGETEYTFDNVANGQTATITYTPSSGTLVNTYDNGTYANDFKVVDRSGADVTSNYTLTDKTPGKLTITDRTEKYEITVVANSSTGNVYDGLEHSAIGFETLRFDVDDNTYTVSGLTTSNPSSINVCNVANEISGMPVVKDVNGNDVTNQFTVKFQNGELEITPLEVTVEITGNNSTDPYDGETHTVTGYTATADSDLYDVNTDIVFSGTATATRTNVVEGDDTDGQTDMGLDASQFTNTNDNFDVTFTIKADGYQEITPIDVTVTIAGNTDSVTYDGQAHTTEGYVVTNISSELYKETDFSFSGEATATRTEVGKTPMGLAERQFTNNNTNFANVTFSVTDGYQEIVAVDEVVVTIVGNNNTATFDGVEHTVTGYTVTSISNPLYTEGDFTFSGSATATRADVGTSQMGLTADQFENTNTNFAKVTFQVTDGYQTIDPLAVTVQISGNNDTHDYDGTTYVVSGYTATADNSLYDVTKDFTFSGTAEAARTDVGTTNMGLDASQFNNTNDNFDVTFEVVADGYVTINPIDVTVTITEHSDEVDYDGNVHTVTGYDVTSIKIDGEDTTLYTAADFTFNGTASVSGTDAGTYPMELEASDFTNTNTNFGTVTFVIVDGSLVIDPIDVVVTIVGNNNTTAYDGETHTVTGYTATASSDLYDVTKDFTFSGTAEATRTDAGKTEMGLAASMFENTNPNFANVTFEVTDGYQTITPIDVTVTITGATGSQKYNGSEQKVEGYEVAIDNELYKESDFTFSGTKVAKGTDVGVYPMGLDPSQFENTNPNFANVTFNVADGQLTITRRSVVMTSASDEKVYNGQPLTNSTVTVTGDGFASGEGATYEVTGSQIEVGESPNRFSYALNEGTKIDNYEITQNMGTLKVTKLTEAVTVTITENSGTETYDGTEKTVTGYTVSISNPLYTEDDFTFNGTATVTGTDADTYDMKLEASDFTNISNNFENVTFVIVDGKLTINQKAVTITTGSDVKEYDGTPLTNDEVTITGLVEGESVTLAATGTQTEVGSSTNTYSITWGNAKASNYTVSEDLGTLKVTENTAEVTLTAESDSKTYDGNALTNDKVTATGLPEGFTVEATAKGSQTDAGESANVVNTGWVIKDASGADKTANFTNVKTVDGTLTVEPKAVTVTAQSHEFAYDGKAHTWAEYDVDGLVGNDAIEATVSGSITFPSESPVTNELEGYEFTTGNPNNYTVTTANGELTMVKAEAEITITAASGEWTYDGDVHSGSTVTVTSGELFEGDELVATATGSATNVADTAAGNNPIAEGYKIMHGNEDVTDNYAITAVAGTLTINPRKVTLTSASDEKVYDGQALTNSTVTVTGDGFASGEGATYDVTGSQTVVGETPNAFTYEPKKGTNFDNYDITKVEGTLKVTPVTDKVTVTITENSGTETYDGTEKTVTGYTVTSISNPLYKEADFSFSGDATVTGTNAGTYDMELKPEDFTNVSENFSNVEFVIVDGQLTINPATIDPEDDRFTVTAPDDVKYNGQAQEQKPTVKDNTTGKDLAEGTDYELTYSNDVTNAGTVTVTITGKGNYTGTTTVTYKINPREVTITSEGGEKVYDGQPLTNSAVTVSGDGFVEGEATVAATGFQTDVGESKNTIEITKGGNFKDSNYTITTEEGTLKVTPATIDPDSDRFEVEELEDLVYNGQAQEQKPTVTDTTTGKPLVEGTDYTLKYSGDTTNVTGEDVTVTVTGTGNYTGSFELTYKITPKDLKVTTGSDTKTYDGTALTNDEVTIEGLVEGETLPATTTGSQTLVGTSPNTVKLGWGDGEKTYTTLSGAIPLLSLLRGSKLATSTNYAVEVELGTLEVTDEGVNVDDVTTKTHEGGEYKLGETVTFTLKATNIYSDARTITFEELEGVTVEQAVFENVEPGATVTTTASYVVTQADVDAGEFKNTVTVTIGDATYTTSDTVTTEKPADKPSGNPQPKPELPQTSDPFDFAAITFMLAAGVTSLAASLRSRRRRWEERR